MVGRAHPLPALGFHDGPRLPIPDIRTQVGCRVLIASLARDIPERSITEEGRSHEPLSTKYRDCESLACGL